MQENTENSKIDNLTQVYKNYEKQLAHFISKIIVSRGVKPEKKDVEDILSDAYLKAATKLLHSKNLEINNYLAWTHKFIFLVTLNFIKTKRKYDAKVLNIEDFEFKDDIYERINNSDPFLLDILESLDDKQKEVIKLSVFLGYTSEEISQKIPEYISAQNVRKIKSRALKKLREKLK